MNIKLYRFVDRFVGVPICGVLSGFSRLRPKPQETIPPRSILIILLSEMGTMVLATSMFERLKQKYPDASLHLLLFARNREAAELLRVVPAVNVLSLDDRSLFSLARTTLNVLRRLWALQIDVVIDCELFARVSSVLSYLSGSPIRVGFHRYNQEGLYRGSFLTRPVLYNPYRHISMQLLTLADAIESRTVPISKMLPVLLTELPAAIVLPEREVQDRITRLHADFPALHERPLVLVYASGGILPIRAWPVDYFKQLCAELLRDGYAIGIIGLKQDISLGDSIVAHCRDPHCVNLSGYTDSMRHLLALFCRASLLIANDGAPGQFAAATAMQAIVLFGPESPVLYGPQAPNVHSMHVPLPCSPCLTAYNHRNSPCDGDNQCLKQIPPEQVLQKARQLLSATSPPRIVPR